METPQEITERVMRQHQQYLAQIKSEATNYVNKYYSDKSSAEREELIRQEFFGRIDAERGARDIVAVADAKNQVEEIRHEQIMSTLTHIQETGDNNIINRISDFAYKHPFLAGLVGTYIIGKFTSKE